MKLRTMFAATMLSVVALPVSAGETINKIGITMVDIPAGSFMMGSCKLSKDIAEENKKRAFLGQETISSNCTKIDSEASDNETPQHSVTIKAFQMSKTEVTLGQFKRFITATGNEHLVNSDFIRFNSHGDDAPVVQVSWHDAKSFIKWLNKTDGGGYRLPTEAEWEYTCQAGGNNTYCGGNDLGVVAWYGDNSGYDLHDVGRKQPNAWGLYDMSGNASEWVEDGFHDTYRGAPGDGSAWSGGKLRVIRGGGSSSVAEKSRATSRLAIPPEHRIHVVGFRLARTR